MIIDLDKNYKKEPQNIEILSLSRDKSPIPVNQPKVVVTALKVEREELSHTDRREFLIKQIEHEEIEVRHARARTHLKYRDLLNANLEPKGPTSAFLEIYEEIEGFTDQLKQLWMRKEHIRHFGEEQKLKVIDDATLAKIDALKHARRRVSDNVYKAKKQLAIASASGNTTKEKNAAAKIDQLQFRYLEIQNELKKLEDVQ